MSDRRIIAQDLDRCPHGRHLGDSCAGWRGPHKFDGGCEGGTSLGNPWFEGRGTRLGTDLGGNPIMSTDSPIRLRPCQWAPVDHYAAGTYVLVLTRPCRHTEDVAPSCREHYAAKVREPVAGRATYCPVCGVRAPLAVVEFGPVEAGHLLEAVRDLRKSEGATDA